MAGMFSACTSEELIENGGTEEGKETSLSLVLTTGEPATKAAEGYQYATADEIKVSNCVVALFKMNGTTVGDMIGKVESYSFDASNTTYNNKPAYSLNNIPAKTGNVRILVVANATNADYTNFTTWSQFMEASTEKALVENDLVKVGWLDKELVAPVTGTIAVPLAQLSAKVKLDISTSNPSLWTYAISKITVEKINKKTDLILTSANSQESLEQLVLDNSNNAERFADLSFYTYENPLAESVKITIEGTLSDENGISETKKYSVELNKTVDNGRLAEGICHGTLYNIKGKIDVTTRTINFSWEIQPWSTTVREVSVDIVDPAFLVVANTEMTMPNMTSISTMFQSSSPITISNIQVSNGTSNSNLNRNITNSGGNSGSINITSELPINFVPKEISFTVTNEEGLSENVKIHQYPPLYIANETTGVSWSDNQGQNNKKMYTFKSLIADFTSFPLPDDRNNVGENSNRWKLRTDYTNFMRNNAVLAYPETKTINESFSSTGYADSKYYRNQNVIETVENAENEYKVSPNFMLASQAGMNTPSDSYGDKKKFCRRYREFTKDGIEYGPGEWRMPTKAELYLIDILQNVKRCDVKKILEGGAYWAANRNIVIMLDPRTSNNTEEAAVRCVRDIK